jgi:hypothetical protein
MGLFDIINFNVASSADSSYDVRLLDTPCDHHLRDEAVNFDISPVISNTPYSGTGTIFNVSTFNGSIDPNAFFFINTQFPYVNDGSFSLRQGVPNASGTTVTETFVIPSGSAANITLMYPPQTNTVACQQIVSLPNNEITFLPFVRYNLYQLYGNIQFTDALDAGSTVQFTYMADKKKIIPTNQDGTLNWSYEGLNQFGQGVFKVYGRPLLSTQAQLYVRYTTKLQSCPKCAGEGILNDLNFDGNGRLQLVYDFSKLIQDYFKRLYTIKGSNSFDISEGTEIQSLIGAMKGDTLTLDALIKSEVINLLYSIRNKQSIQQGIQGIGLGEQIAQIDSVDVTSPTSTSLKIVVSVSSLAGITQQVSSTITIGGK